MDYIYFFFCLFVCFLPDFFSVENCKWQGDSESQDAFLPNKQSTSVVINPNYYIYLFFSVSSVRVCFSWSGKLWRKKYFSIFIPSWKRWYCDIEKIFKTCSSSLFKTSLNLFQNKTGFFCRHMVLAFQEQLMLTLSMCHFLCHFSSELGQSRH